MDQNIEPEASKTREADEGNRESNKNRTSWHKNPWETPGLDDAASHARRDSLVPDRTIKQTTKVTLKSGEERELPIMTKSSRYGNTPKDDHGTSSSRDGDQGLIIALEATKLGNDDIDAEKVRLDNTNARRRGDLSQGHDSTHPSLTGIQRGEVHDSSSSSSHPQSSLPSHINVANYLKYQLLQDLAGTRKMDYGPCYPGCPCEDGLSRGLWDKPTQEHYRVAVDFIRPRLEAKIDLEDINFLERLFDELLEVEENKSRAFWLWVSRIKDILHARLDKLVEEILKVDPARVTHAFGWNEGKLEKGATVFAERILPKAQALQLKWQTEYKDRYLKIDTERRKEMVVYGAFRRVRFNPKYKEDGKFFDIEQMLSTEGTMYSAKVWGKKGFKVGCWYLNIWCAARDGMVGNPARIVTEGAPGEVTALALLTGTETDGKTPGTYEYTLDDAPEDINLTMLAQRGRSIRLLRGHRLKSKYAPVAGVRFDGLYAISGDSRKVINEDTKSCRLSITLVQYTQNSPHSELAQIPLPSQLDEWKQYNQLLVQWEEKQKAAGTEVGAWPETPTTATLL